MRALLCACALNLAAWGMQTVHAFHFFGETTATDVAIHVSNSSSKMIGVCPHHPHGCPKECMCPKTYLRVGDSDDEDGALRSPSLVACTESDSEFPSPSFAVFIAETPATLNVCSPVSSLSLRKALALPSPLREPPQKIPIV
jgi:hypothetical protein